MLNLDQVEDWWMAEIVEQKCKNGGWREGYRMQQVSSHCPLKNLNQFMENPRGSQNTAGGSVSKNTSYLYH